MNKSRLLGAACACLISLSFNSSAAIVDNDTYTTDTTSSLDWLDLTATVNMSHDDVTAQLDTGGMFEGWSYATRAQISGFWDAFGGDSMYYEGWAAQNNGLFDLIAPLWGDTYCAAYTCAVGDGYSFIITADRPSPGKVWAALAYDSVENSGSADADQFVLSRVELFNDSVGAAYGSALIRVSAVPIPASVWLFGSGLLGLIGISQRKK